MKINMSECGVCEICVESCPLGLIKKKGFKMVILEGCDNCGECQKICPMGCIIK
ncbi:MAG: 4Fe-4S binding protein [Methanobrevibacter sp.]|uniref:4Fe-4S binding protein n=1 Tax=Methanobrevibacter sp. TaxID=66852 RepID=UPI00260BBA28|nr:4Fe-4S binding protein [Methanobrevibacter sp.]MEA4956834.1 4Fe-4S binding protein [Methanobrevibacter sp.]